MIWLPISMYRTYLSYRIYLAAATGRTLNFNLTAMRMCNMPHQRQPQATAFRVMDQRIARAIKLLEDPRLFIPLDPNPAIAHFELEQRVVAIQPDPQKLLAVGILQRIVNEVHERARNRFAIDLHLRNARIDLLFERESLLLDLKTIGVERVAHELGDVRLAEVVLFAARFDAREVENVIDQCGEPFTLFTNDAVVLVLLLFFRDASELECLCVESNQRERRAQLVR